VAKNLEGQLPTPGEFTAEDEAMLARADALLEICRREFDVQAIHSALEAIWSVLGETNRYFSLQQPWVLRKTDPDRMATVLYVTIEVLRIVSILAQPVMPDSASRILDLLGASNREFTDIATRSVPGTALPTPTPVFPKYE
ncbi:MAG: class I tRNA ligase family protein, partial [Rhodococcus sp. (in: high G+C Gram-positive bacteria)]